MTHLLQYHVAATVPTSAKALRYLQVRKSSSGQSKSIRGITARTRWTDEGDYITHANRTTDTLCPRQEIEIQNEPKAT